jgi:two-component system sensor histidine kinase/response regulator
MKTILSLLLIFSFSSLCVAKDKGEPSESIRIIGVENSSPFSFTLPDGRTTGLYIEYWRLWSKSNNIPIEIVMQPFDVAMDTIKNKGVVIQGIFINDERKQWADFSNPIHNLESGIIFSNKYSKDIKFSELSDARVAVQAASHQANYIAEKYPSLNLVFYENTSDGIKKLLNKEVDAVVGEIPNLKIELTILRLDGVYTISDEVLLNNNVHAALAKGQPSLLKIINEGIDNIPIQSLIELEKKWLPSIEPFFSNNTLLTSLTMAEIKWLQQLPSLRLGINSNWRPYEYIDNNGDFSGLSSDYIDYIKKALSLKVEANKNYSWFESLAAMKDNKIDVMSTIVRTTEREKSMLFTEPYFSSTTVIVSRKNGFNADTLDNLKGRTIGIPSGYALMEFIETDYPEITIIPVDSVADGLSKLNNSKFDAFISEISSVNYTINKEQFADLIITGFSPYNLEVSMAVRTELEPLVGILNKVFLSISEKEKVAISNNWLSTKVQRGIKLSTVVLWVFPIASFLMLIVIIIFFRLNRRLRIHSQIINTMTEGAYLIRVSDGIIIYANPSFESMFGYTEGEMIGQHVAIVNASADIKSFEMVEFIAEQIIKAGEWHGEVKNIRKDGTSFWCSASVTAFSHPVHGDVWVAVHTDITERKQMEEELFKGRKLESVGLLAGGIAHDFNNILTGMFGNIELAKLKLPTDHAAYQHIQTANQAMDRATSLTSQLLTFAKGGNPLFEIVDIKPIIQDAIKFSLSGTNVKPILTLQEDLWMLNADKGQLSQVITNLLINANHAMPKGGTLTIEANNIEEITDSSTPQLSGGFICLKISDEGVGISQEHQKHIFDPYFTTKQSGSGLGLATAHSIIAKHNGHISVESELDKGTTFSIYLPAKPDYQVVEKVLLNDAISPIENPGHILVMDDEEMILDISAEMLKSLGYSVETAIDGKQAIEKYIDADKNGRPFDVVIMDLTIPGGIGGKDAIKQLLDINPQVKAIVSSGYSTNLVMSNYTEYGFKGRLAKPFIMEALENELFKILK